MFLASGLLLSCITQVSFLLTVFVAGSQVSFEHLWFVNPHYHHILLLIYFTTQTVLVS